ncbi:MAG: 6-bladed beta-propeller, partial [bacterium]
MKRVSILAALSICIAAAASADFKYAGQWGSPGAAAGEFNAPTGIAVAPNGNVYVADAGNHRVQRFT